MSKETRENPLSSRVEKRWKKKVSRALVPKETKNVFNGNSSSKPCSGALQECNGEKHYYYVCNKINKYECNNVSYVQIIIIIIM